MLQTDLNGLWEKCKNSKECQLLLLLLVCIILYYLLSRYLASTKKNTLNNTLLKNIMMYNSSIPINGNGNMMSVNMSANRCDNDSQKLDEILFRNMINLPTQDPEMLTSSMVIPKNMPSDEDRRRTRMDVLNMFYTSFDDDSITIKNRPQDLYIIP